jgi:peptidoglycan/LPS O-acetylase OafA/YrhL
MLFIPRPALNVALFFLYGMDGKFLEDFAVGMLISCCYLLSQRVQAGDGLRELTEKVKRRSLWLWGAGILVLLFMTLWNGDLAFPHSIPIFDPIHDAYPFYSELGLSIGFGLCVTAILFGPATLRRPFEWPLMRWIGIISYSLYIWHLPILDHLGIYVVRLVAGWSHPLAYGLLWLFAALVVIPFSHLFYRWIECPWMQLGDRLGHK